MSNASLVALTPTNRGEDEFLVRSELLISKVNFLLSLLLLLIIWTLFNSYWTCLRILSLKRKTQWEKNVKDDLWLNLFCRCFPVEGAISVEFYQFSRYIKRGLGLRFAIASPLRVRVKFLMQSQEGWIPWRVLTHTSRDSLSIKYIILVKLSFTNFNINYKLYLCSYFNIISESLNEN